MASLNLLPPPLRPPHDPITISLNGDQNWRDGAIHKLDSGIQRCQWHRIVLNGHTPPATAILVRTFTADVPLPPESVEKLQESDWVAHPVARNIDGEWDCLIRSAPGRYLWIRMHFASAGDSSPEVTNVDIQFPRISLRRYLPAVFGENPESADFTDRFLSLFDTTFRELESQIDNQARLFDPRSTPSGAGYAPAGTTSNQTDFLSWLAGWVGITLDKRWSEARRRNFLRKAPALYDIRGTREGLWKLLLLYLGIDEPFQSELKVDCTASKSCTGIRTWCPPPLILEHYQLRRWLFIGRGRLGDDAVLWGRGIVNRSQLDEGAQTGQSQLKGTLDPLRDPFHVYASRFTVFVPASYGKTVQQRKMLTQLVKNESPAHVQYSIEYVEPRLRVGVQSMIGLDSVIGKYPEGGVRIGESTLRGGTVIGESVTKVRRDGKTISSSQIGSTIRVGSNTRLA